MRYLVSTYNDSNGIIDVSVMEDAQVIDLFEKHYSLTIPKGNDVVQLVHARRLGIRTVRKLSNYLRKNEPYHFMGAIPITVTTMSGEILIQEG